MGLMLLENAVLPLLILNLRLPPSDLELLKSIHQQIQSQGKQIKGISGEINKLKKDYQNLNKQLSKEISFKEGLKLVLASEGGISNDAADKGGLTNLGITHGEYAKYLAQKGLSSRPVTKISLLEAKDIYKHVYWLNSGCGLTPRRIAISCFDWQVNSGRGFATLQQVLGVANDGIPGHKTFNELDYWLSKPGHEDRLLHNYFSLREEMYKRWALGSQRVFLDGWLRRSRALKEYLKVP